MKKIHTLFLIVVLLLTNRALDAQCSGTPTGWGLTPSSQTICAGNTATMMLVTINPNTSSYSFQWQSSTVSPVGPWQNLTGVTGWTYTTAPTFTTTWYSVVVTCNTSSMSANFTCVVTVSNCGQPCGGQPATTSIVPLNQTVCAGGSANMSLSTTYTDTGISYKWGASPSAAGPFTAVPNATLNNLSTGSILNTTYYNVTVTCANSSLSTVATQTVSVVSCSNCTGPPPANTVVPLNHTVCTGASTTMSLMNTYTASGYTYQWQSSTISSVGPFTSIPGATLSSYTTPGLNQTTYYNLVITCANGGQFISLLHTITVLNCLSPCTGAPATTSVLPVSHTLCIGDEPAMMLSTTYSNTGITYQWSSSTVQSGPYTAIPGATVSSYTATPIFANMFYSVAITCTNSQLSTSVTHSVSVVNCTYCAGPPISNTILPLNVLCLNWPNMLFLMNTYTASGLTYQWHSSSTSSVGPFIPVNGATQPTLNVFPTTMGNIYYQLVVTCTNTGKATNIIAPYQVLICSGLHESSFVPAKIYPNPTNGLVEIEVSSGSAELNLTDISGRSLIESKVTDSHVRLSLYELPSGLYLLKIRHQGREETVKLIKE